MSVLSMASRSAQAVLIVLLLSPGLCAGESTPAKVTTPYFSQIVDVEEKAKLLDYPAIGC